MIIMRGRGRFSILENDCMDILLYAASCNGRWVPLSELAERSCIPNSTLRTIFAISKSGVFVKETEVGCIVHQDIFDKIAKKHKIEYKIKKMKDADGRNTWHISAIKLSYAI